MTTSPVESQITHLRSVLNRAHVKGLRNIETRWMKQCDPDRVVRATVTMADGCIYSLHGHASMENAPAHRTNSLLCLAEDRAVASALRKAIGETAHCIEELNYSQEEYHAYLLTRIERGENLLSEYEPKKTLRKRHLGDQADLNKFSIQKLEDYLATLQDRYLLGKQERTQPQSAKSEEVDHA